MEYTTRLRELREKAGKSQQFMANAIGISDTSYQNYEYGKRDMPADILIKIAEYYGVSADYILYVTDSAVDIPTGLVRVPLIGRISAGEPIPMEEIDRWGEAPARFKADDKDVFLLKVEGDSVNKKIHNGDLALVSPKYKEPNEHDLFAVCVNGHDATIKHVKQLANGFALIPDSYDPTYREQIFDYNDESTSEITIIGKVVWHCAAY